MKKTYQNPAMEMITLMNEDILTTSGQDAGSIKGITFDGIFGVDA